MVLAGNLGELSVWGGDGGGDTVLLWWYPHTHGSFETLSQSETFFLWGASFQLSGQEEVLLGLSLAAGDALCWGIRLEEYPCHPVKLLGLSSLLIVI